MNKKALESILIMILISILVVRLQNQHNIPTSFPQQPHYPQNIVPNVIQMQTMPQQTPVIVNQNNLPPYQQHPPTISCSTTTILTSTAVPCSTTVRTSAITYATATGPTSTVPYATAATILGSTAICTSAIPHTTAATVISPQQQYPP